MQESERLKKLAKHYGSQANFAKKLGVGQSNVTNWIKRGTLPTGAIRLISQKCPDVSIGWLTTGRGEMIVKASGQVASESTTRGVVVKVIEDNIRKVSGRGVRRFGLRYTTPPSRVRVKPVGLREITAYQGDGVGPISYNAAFKAYVAQKRASRRGGFLDASRTTFEDVITETLPAMPVVVSVPSASKKEKSNIGKRKINEILNEALGKSFLVAKNDDGTIALVPYNIEEGSKLAVVPVEKDAETYIKVDGFAMSPTINNGDVIGVAATDWFERFSKEHIYTIKLMTGEILTRRIVPPAEDVSTIRLVSDNPQEADLELSRGDIKEIKRVTYIGKSL